MAQHLSHERCIKIASSVAAVVLLVTGCASGGASVMTVNKVDKIAAAASASPAPAPPGFASDAAATFATAKSGAYTVYVTSSLARISEQGRLPPGVTFRSGRYGVAQLGGVPRAGTGGRYPITLIAVGPSGRTSQSFTLTVDQPPAIAAGNDIWIIAFKYDYTPITATGYPAPEIDMNGSLPSGLTFADNGGGDAVISGRPDFIGWPGNVIITVTARNSLGSVTKGITVIPVTPTSLGAICLVLCPEIFSAL